eukprot:6203797-Pleurochrysis_carterae.AAC.1
MAQSAECAGRIDPCREMTRRCRAVRERSRRRGGLMRAQPSGCAHVVALSACNALLLQTRAKRRGGGDEGVEGNKQAEVGGGAKRASM